MDEPGVIAAFVVAAVALAVFVWRCTWHRAPIVDLGLLRIRTFSVSNAMTIAGAAGFAGTPAHVLFLTQVWEYSVLEAGLAITPGRSSPSRSQVPQSTRGALRPSLGARRGGPDLGPRGALVRGAGQPPAFTVSDWLPGMIILGIGAAPFPEPDWWRSRRRRVRRSRRRQGSTRSHARSALRSASRS